MGFTETQAEHVHDTVSRVRGGSVAKRAPSTLTALFVLGLNPSSVLKVLEKCPDLYAVKESQLQQRIGNLRKLGLVEGGIMLLLCNTVNQSTSKHCLNGSAHQSLVFFFFGPCLGSLQRVVAYYPQILTVPVKTVKSVVLFLRGKCLFTAQQVTDILRESPAIVVENTAQLEYKFQVSM